MLATILFLLSIIFRTDCSFLVTCDTLAENIPVDPIVAFGKRAEHDHSFFGSNAISSTTTSGETLADACCTTCSGNDHSSYWIPTLMWQHDDGSTETANVLTFTAYWNNARRGTLEHIPITLPPLGLRHITGSPFATTAAEGAFCSNFQCYNNGVYGPQTSEYPAAYCSKMRLQLFMPDCWNGIDLFLPNSKHVAFADENGACPKSFVHIWQIRVEIEYNIPESWYWDATSVPHFILGNSKHTSPHSVHIDYINGLGLAQQQSLLQTCGTVSADNCLELSPARQSCPATALLGQV